MKKKDIIPGEEIGFWTPLRVAGYQRTSRMWMCRCRCGTKRKVREHNLKSLTSLSCGCRGPQFGRKKATARNLGCS